MWPFRAKEPPPDNDITVIPVTLDEAHTYVQPRGDHPNQYKYGTTDYSPQVGTELPTIAHQDAILTHWYRPPDTTNLVNATAKDTAPSMWWDDTNSDKLLRGRQERFTTGLGHSQTDRQLTVENPWLARHPLPRVTSDMSPSTYRFERPFDQRFERRFNGSHFSMASNRRTYPVNGMEPMPNFRNTFRLEPTVRDAENVDLATDSTPAAVPAVYVSPPTAASSRWGL